MRAVRQGAGHDTLQSADNGPGGSAGRPGDDGCGRPTRLGGPHPCSGVGYRVDLTESGGLNEDLRIFFPAYLHDGRTDGGAGYWSCALAQGARNDAVTMLQFSINRCYYPHVVDTLAEDGDFGSKTKAALVKVQRQHGIEANGQYGRQPWSLASETGYQSCARLEHFGWPGVSG